jgi:hypothetical protein
MSGFTEIKQRLRKKWKVVMEMGLITVGIFVSVVVVLNYRDIRDKAFSGFDVNRDALSKKSSEYQSGGSKVATVSDGTQKKLFGMLTETYLKPDVQDIDVPDLKISGVVMLAYDEKINKSFVYSRLNNFFVPAGQILRMWIIGKDNKILPGSVSEFTLESGELVAYNVFAAEGDLRKEYQFVVYSFDNSLESSKPDLTVITVLF